MIPRLQRLADLSEERDPMLHRVRLLPPVAVSSLVGRRFGLLVAVWALLIAAPLAWGARGHARMDELALDRWAQLRETERYQLNIAEKFYRENLWKEAAAEYEKFLSLYERSEGAPFAQLKWSMCQVHVKKLNTAIKDGYQTVIDYWPDSPESVAAAYLIGRTYKDMGDLPQAKKAYAKVVTDLSDEMVSILARLDLADIARIEQDRVRRIAVLKDLVFNAPRAGDAARLINESSRTLAVLLWQDGAFVDGKNSLGTTYKEPQLAYWVWHDIRGTISELVNQPDTKDKGLKLADAAVAYFREQVPATPKDDAEHAHVRLMHFNAADIHMYAARPEEAGKIYDQLLKTYSTEDDLISRYAGWLKSQNRRDEARSVYRRMKNEFAGLSNVAYSYREEGKQLQAVPFYEELISKDTQNAKTWYWHLAETYREAGKHQESIPAFQQSESYPECLNRIAGAYRAMGKFKEAIATYTQVLGGYESAAPQALLQIGYTQEQAQEKDTAIKTFMQVCKRFPKSGEASQAHTHLNNKYNILITGGGDKQN